MQTISIDDYQIQITDKYDQDIDQLLGIFYKCEQIHSDKVYVRESGQDFIKQQADAIVTNSKNVKIAVRVADCVPIVLMGNNYFAIVHAGWRGLKSGIVSNAINILQSKNEDQIKMFIGPSIRSCCYEVGGEFKEYFDAKYLFVREGKLYLDMIGVAKDIALAYGIKNDAITISPDCTYCGGKHFSYRKGDSNQRILVAVEKH